MSRSLADQDWLKASATRAVMQALAAEGGPDCARFVGGCVRNALIGAPIDDIDIATRLKPEAVVRALKQASLKVVPTGIEHGTVTGVAEGRPFEITTLRRDVSTDGRRATVAFTDDWAEDAARRDFRLNALYADAEGRILDPTGHGVDDAEAGRIVFVGAPEARIREDYLRILRFFRFHAWYGRGEPDAGGLAACAALSEGVSRLSAERVSKELLKLLAAPDPRPSIRLMKGAGVLDQVLDEPSDLSLFEAVAGRSDDVAIRLSALLPAHEASVREAAARLRLPNALRDRLARMVADDGVVVGGTLSDQAARAAIYRLGAQTFMDRLARASAGQGPPERLVQLARDWTLPRLPVGGRDVAKLGLSPGPETGRLLARFEQDWIAADFPDVGHEDRLRKLASRPG